MFIYCANNPITMKDPDGFMFRLATDVGVNVIGFLHISNAVGGYTTKESVTTIGNTMIDDEISKISSTTTVRSITQNLANRSAKRQFARSLGQGVTMDTVVPRIGVQSLKTLSKVGILGSLLALPSIIDNFTGNYKHPWLRTGLTLLIIGICTGITVATGGMTAPIVLLGMGISTAASVEADYIMDNSLGEKKH